MKISSKISLMGVSLVAVSALAILGLVMVQKQILRSRLTEIIIHKQAFQEAASTVQALYRSFEAADARTQRRLDYNFQVTREQLARAGQASLGAETLPWQASNQVTKAAQSVTLPRFMVGATWLGQNATAKAPSPVVDEVKYFTRDQVTIFQRMNDAGDMLRVCTTILNSDGTRAIGTFIPHQNPDGTENPVVRAVLQGETYRGRAQVVNEWYVTQYAPLWDAKKEKVIGMLFVGVSLTDITKDLRQAILATKLGKTGYAFVLGANGDQKGCYIFSKGGERDGENVWSTQDAGGGHPIQSMLEKALKTQAGSVDILTYSWKNSGEATPRPKFAAVTQFAPYDWVLGAGTYEDDYHDLVVQMEAVLAQLLWWVALAAGVLGCLALVISRSVARTITRPIEVGVELLNGVSRGDLTQSVPEALRARTDEAGELSRSIHAMTESLRKVLGEVSGGAQTLASSATELSAVSSQTADTVRSMSDQATTVAAAAEEASANTTSVAAGMEQAATNLASVASATEEMSATVGEIAANSEKARAISERASAQAQVITSLMQQLGQAAREIGQVTETITDISSQTNLLALNATIEAARAGAAGKGFAVVAHEIKELARQTATATEDIKAKIAGVQTSAGSAMADIEKISGVISDVGAIVASIAAAIEEQATVTKDVAGNIAQASSGVRDSNERVAQTVTVSKSMAQDIARISAGVNDLRQGGEQVEASAGDLTKLAEQLKATVSQFKVDGRTAATPSGPARAKPAPSAPAARSARPEETLIQWSEDYSVEVLTMDAHHQKLISLINQLYAALQRGEGTLRTQGILKQVIAYTQYHFRAEEEHMAQMHFSGLEAQKKAHADFLGAVAVARDRWEAGDNTVPQEMLATLKRWLVQHITGMDKQYAPSALQRATAAPATPGRAKKPGAPRS